MTLNLRKNILKWILTFAPISIKNFKKFSLTLIFVYFTLKINTQKTKQKTNKQKMIL